MFRHNLTRRSFSAALGLGAVARPAEAARVLQDNAQEHTHGTPLLQASSPCPVTPRRL